MQQQIDAMGSQFESLKAQVAGLQSEIDGGAVITEDYKEQIGADGYAKDAAEAVKVVQSLLAE